MTERVVVKQGATTTEFTYSAYQDWNNPLNKIGVLYAGKLTERRNGTVVRDLTTDLTETGNVYVVAPVPASVQAAEKVTGQLPHGVMAKVEPPVNKSAPTPRLDGHPDLTGNWSYTDWIGNYQTGGGRRCAPGQREGCSRQTNQTEDFELYSPSRFGNTGRPIYKPEYWDKVQQLDMWTNKYDPVMTCQPLGVPREGPPRRIYPDGQGRRISSTREAMPAADTASTASSRSMAARTAKTRSPITRISGIPWGTGRATRSCSTPSRSPMRRGSGAAVSSTPIRCMSSSDSRVRAMHFCTMSRWKTPPCWCSRG